MYSTLIPVFSPLQGCVLGGMKALSGFRKSRPSPLRIPKRGFHFAFAVRGFHLAFAGRGGFHLAFAWRGFHLAFACSAGRLVGCPRGSATAGWGPLIACFAGALVAGGSGDGGGRWCQHRRGCRFSRRFRCLWRCCRYSVRLLRILRGLGGNGSALQGRELGRERWGGRRGRGGCRRGGPELGGG